MTYRFKAFLILFLFVQLSGLAQYSAGDVELIKTVFNRQFDKKIINQYLNSPEAAKRNAALLAIANSGDSTFITAVIQSARKSQIGFTAFALGRLGESTRSAEFLMNQLTASKRDDACREIYTAIGRTGSRQTLEKLTALYLEKKLPSTWGISLAVHQFLQRNIAAGGIYEILKAEAADPSVPLPQACDALFALARNAMEISCKETILKLFNSTDFNLAKPEFSQYLLMAMRRYNLLPKDTRYLATMTACKTTIVRIEAAKLFSGFQFSDSLSLFKYVSLLNDVNPNVRLQCAQSLKNLKQLPQNLKMSLLDYLITFFRRDKLNSNEKAELYVSLLSLEPQLKRIMAKDFSSFAVNHRLKICAEVPDLFTEEAKTELAGFGNLPTADKLKCLNQLGQLANQPRFKPLIDSLTLQILKNDPDPVLLAGFLDGIDSAYVVRYGQYLQQPIAKLAAKNCDDPLYAEIFNQILSLPQAINYPFINTAREMLRSSKIRSIQKKFNTTFSDTALFNRLAPFLGRSSKLKVITTAGQFLIELSPDIAPLSSANMLYLTGRSYFKGIKFHRVVPGFVIQAGDPTATGSGGPGYEIVTELSPLHYSPGTLGMARSNFDTEGSQWFITTGDYNHLDGGYSIFGKVIKGMDVVELISENDSIISISIQDK